MKKTNQLLNALIVSTRPVPSAIAWFAAGAILAAAGGTALGPALIRTLPMFLVAQLSFVLNDVLDRRKDAIGGRSTPITRHELSCATSLLFALVLAVVALLLEVVQGTSHTVFVLAVSLILAVGYSPLSLRLPIGKNLYAALLALAPLVYAGALADCVLPVAPLAGVFCFLVGRELLIDVKDLESDARSGLQTLAAALNYSAATVIGIVMLLVGSLVLAISSSRVGPVGGCAFVITCVAGGLFVYHRDTGLQLSRISLVLGIIAFAQALT